MIVIGPSSLVQGMIPADRRPHNLLRVRRLEAAVLSPGGERLVHYHRDQTRPDRPWIAGEVISDRPLGPGAIAADRGRLREPGPLHVLVPERTDAGVALAHYVRLNGAGESHRWRRAGELPGESAVLRFGAGRLRAAIRCAEGVQGMVWDGRRWLEDAIAPATPSGESLPWARDAVAWALADTALCGLPAGSLAAGLPGGDAGVAWPAVLPGGRGWRQALVQEGGSVYQWHRQEWRGRVRWVRAACLRLDPGDGFDVEARQSRKLAQVTGERDTQPGVPDATLSRSESRSGVRGTDLGVRVEHRGESYLLFGDTHWSRPWLSTRDAVGRVTREGPRPGLPGVDVHGAPLRIVGGLATSREYDVPLDAFGAGDDLFAFFSSHHFQRHQVMGRSLLTRLVGRALDVDPGERRRPVAFRKVATFSDRFFVNVSVSRRGDLLYVWGSGSYRADDLRLAALDLSSPAVRAALAGRGRWRRPLEDLTYWAGTDADGVARWSPHEDDAAPVVRGAFGEISVRWVAELDAYVLLAMAGPEDPIGPSVTLRTAPAPWGPWTRRRRLFDWIANGMAPHDEASRFIRASHDNDPVGDRIFAQQAAMTGAAYAPYLFDARRDGDDVVLRYTLSTWNPYQVVLMEHRLAAPLRGVGEPAGRPEAAAPRA